MCSISFLVLTMSPTLHFSNPTSGQPVVNASTKTEITFASKLYYMLEDEEVQGTGLVHWSAEGTSFICPNTAEFSK